MIGFILNAILQEAKTFNSQTAGQTMLKTDYKSTKIADYTMPLVLLQLDDAPDTYQYPGGLTRTGWMFSFNSYNYSPDSYIDDNTGYSTELLYNPIDTIREHFSLGSFGNGLVFQDGQLISGIIYQVTNGSITYNGDFLAIGVHFTAVYNALTFSSTDGGYVVGTSWCTQGMVEIFNKYEFQFTLSGIGIAEQIDDSGLVLGYKIQFDSTAFDFKTNFIKKTIPLNTVTQIDPGESIS